ncbi:ATP-grasp domain-containing protein [Microcoleus sp. Pol14C2]|uniref:ATP-grasp domain-containing protein n=1 Tax=unclassified Microcoleus TaxID=2642155 RepID=UPI002FCEC388
MTISHKLPVPSSNLFVWVFIPYCIKGQELSSEEYDNPATHQELADVFAELCLKWKWQPITLENMHTVIEEVAASSKEYIPLVLNFCAGDEDPNYPGTCVIKLLEAKGILFTGADSTFDYLCSSKLRMKRAFVETDVATAPYEVIADPSHVQGVCERLGTPLIVKPAMSMGSRGLSLQSVVESDEQVSKQVQWLLQGQHDMQFPLDSIFVERFINGREFTVFLLGSTQQPESIKIYPPVERVFHSNLPETERFLTYERAWAKEESSLSLGEPFYRYQLVASDLHDRLCELSKHAYCVVGGNGYARVDIRMEKASQEIFVLEVNPNCGVSSIPLFDFSNPSATSVGTILHLAGIPFAQLMSEIIAEAFERHSTKSPLVSKSA